MKLFEYETILPYAIEDVFSLTVDLANAPHWHSIFTHVEALTEGKVDKGSQWRMHYGIGSFDLTITHFLPPTQVDFIGSRVMGMFPGFRIRLEAVDGGTQVHYYLEPDVPAIMRPIMALIGPAYGRRDLARYFRELNEKLSSEIS